MEIWKDIKGYSYKYQISNMGNIRCLNPFHKNKKGKNYKLNKDSYGYLVVALVLNKKPYYKKVHRLVYKYFKNDFNKNLTINHIDHNKTNNNISNLELMTFSENRKEYINNVLKKNTSSKQIGVSYHKQIDKWTTKVNHKGKRLSVGVFDNEEDAIYAVNNYTEKDFKTRGQVFKGKSKYSEDDNIKALLIAEKIGVRKAGKETKMGSTRISTLRKKYKKHNNTYIKLNE